MMLMNKPELTAMHTYGLRLGLQLGQGRIEPPKAARGHATYIDGKMLSVTKYRIQIWTA